MKNSDKYKFVYKKALEKYDKKDVLEKAVFLLFVPTDITALNRIANSTIQKASKYPDKELQEVYINNIAFGLEILEFQECDMTMVIDLLKDFYKDIKAVESKGLKLSDYVRNTAPDVEGVVLDMFDVLAVLKVIEQTILHDICKGL